MGALFERAPHGIAVADLSGRYVSANPAFLGLLGLGPAELGAQSLRDLAGTQDDGEFEKRYVRKDGQALWVRVMVARIAGAGGEPDRLLAIVEDISMRRHADEREELQRHRIAAELHDRVGQQLSALNINLDIALGMAGPQAGELRLRLADSLSLVEGSLQAIEDLMAELRPPLLEEYGLAAALGLLARQFTQRTGVPAAVDDASGPGKDLRPEAAIALFRIAQEALANVAKHAQARKVKITLAKGGAGADNSVMLEIHDDGCGFDRNERLRASARWGMTTMQERAAAAGGRLEVHSASGAGTTVRVML